MTNKHADLRPIADNRHHEILTRYDELLTLLDLEGPTMAAATLSSSRDAFLNEFFRLDKTGSPH
jgi:hypothetical protein